MAYFDYLTSNGERYFPYTRVDGIFDVNGNPFTDWIATMNIHNHDIRYAAASHTHDTRYSLLSHEHDGYAAEGHTHNYAGSSKAGGAANTALALDKAFTLNVSGIATGSVSILGNADVSLDLAMNHNHDENYVKLDSNNTIVASEGIDDPLNIKADGGKAKIGLNTAAASYAAFIEYDGTAINIGIGEDSVLKYNQEALYHNGEKLATEAFVLAQAMSGGTDLTVLDTRYSQIGHTHNISEIGDVPTKLSNPYSLTIDFNGTETVYDGSSDVSLSLTAGSMGAATADHIHSVDQITNLQTILDGKQPVGSYALSDHNHDAAYVKLDSAYNKFGNSTDTTTRIHLVSANTSVKISAADEIKGSVITVKYNDETIMDLRVVKDDEGHNTINLYMPGYEDDAIMSIEAGQAESTLADGTVVEAIRPKVTINADVVVASLTDLSASNDTEAGSDEGETTI